MSVRGWLAFERALDRAFGMPARPRRAVLRRRLRALRTDLVGGLLTRLGRYDDELDEP